MYEDENGEQVHDGRNNLGVISLNLPRIALEAKGDEAAFWALLDERLQLARKALMTRIARLEGVKARVAPILYMEGACGVRLKADDDVSEIFKNGRASISLWATSVFTKRSTRCSATSTCMTATPCVKKVLPLFSACAMRLTSGKTKPATASACTAPRVKTCVTVSAAWIPLNLALSKGVTDKGYYTNSFHLDVEKKVNPYDKIDFEAAYPPVANGGFICYGEYPNIQHNLKALEDVWDYSYQHVPYYGTNTPIDECYECGFTGEFECTSKGFTCPKCGNHDAARVSVTRRVWLSRESRCASV